MDAANKTSKSTKSAGSKDGEIRDDQDQYCWLCHKDKCNLSCQICPRSYHLKCINNNPSYAQLDSFTLLNDKKTFIKDDWVCFECEIIAKSESDEGKSECMRRINKEQFNELLGYALKIIKKTADVTFHTPVNLEIYQDYSTFVVHPMDLYKIEQYVTTNKYSSTEAFLSDLKWVLHDCYIFNSATSPLTFNARATLKTAKNQMYEIETCPDCFKNQFTYPVKDFFVQTCSYPHQLVLAKVSGHPPWPSKVVKYNEQTKQAEVRFFGTPHDKAWCTLNNCLMLTEIPGTGKVTKNQRNKLEAAISELKTHLELLNARFPNLFQFSPPKTTLTPDRVYLIPPPEGLVAPPTPSSIGASSAPLKDPSLINESLASENSETITQPARKQQKTAAAASAKSSVATPKAQQKHVPPEEPSVVNENDFSSLNDDSDDDNDKLVIDDESLNSARKRPPKRKHQDSTSSNKSTSTVATSRSSVANQSVQKRKLSAVESPQPSLKNESLLKEVGSVPKKKSKKSANDSVASNSFAVQNIQQQPMKGPFATEKEQQLFKQVQYYKDELERSRAIHISEIKEMFENHKSEFRDLKTTLEAEKAKALASLRKDLEAQHAKSIEETKRKSWCVQCLKEASYFCCRLASYCGYECQSQHWVTHMTNCLQNKTPATTSTTSESAAATESTEQSEKPEQPSNGGEHAPEEESGKVEETRTPAKEQNKKLEQQAAANEPTAAATTDAPEPTTATTSGTTERTTKATTSPTEPTSATSATTTNTTESTRQSKVESASSSTLSVEKPARSPVKKIKQIIQEKNEQQSKNELHSKNESIKPAELAAEPSVEVKSPPAKPIEQEPITKKAAVERPITENPTVEKAPTEKVIVKEPVVEKPIVEKPIVEKPVVEKPVVEKQITEKAVEKAVEKPVVERQIVEKAVEKPLVEKPVEHAPGKPKDRFLRKLNEDKSNQIASQIKPQPVASVLNAAEDKSTPSSESDKAPKKDEAPAPKKDEAPAPKKDEAPAPKKDEAPADKSGESADKPLHTDAPSKEVSEEKMDVDEPASKKGDESKAETKNEAPDDLARMRELLIKKMMEKQKESSPPAVRSDAPVAGDQRKEPAKERPAKERLAEDAPSKELIKEKTAVVAPAKELIKEKTAVVAPAKVSDSVHMKSKAAPVSQFSLERRIDVNLSEESDEEDELVDEVRPQEEPKVLKKPFHIGELDDLDDDSNLMDELISSSSSKPVDLSEENSKDTESRDKVDVKLSDDSSTNDQSTNQKHNEEISGSNDAADQSPIHSDVHSVKDDLISKVENELKS